MVKSFFSYPLFYSNPLRRPQITKELFVFPSFRVVFGSTEDPSRWKTRYIGTTPDSMVTFHLFLNIRETIFLVVKIVFCRRKIYNFLLQDEETFLAFLVIFPRKNSPKMTSKGPKMLNNIFKNFKI